MKERPILFSAPMVRAILDGSKTQTRRVLKKSTEFKGPYNPAYIEAHKKDTGWREICPYGKIRDRLWVRETWGIYSADGGTQSCTYCADYPKVHMGQKWTPSIYMPRWASRIDLEITDIRIELLQDISRGDAMDEGCPFQNMAKGDDPRKWYADLWESINGAGSWAANPWVWVVKFKRVRP